MVKDARGKSMSACRIPVSTVGLNFQRVIQSHLSSILSEQQQITILLVARKVEIEIIRNISFWLKFKPVIDT